MSSNSAGRNHMASSSLLILVPSKLMGSSKSPCPALLYHIRLSPALCAWVQLARIYPQNKAHLIRTGSPRSTLYFRQSTDQSVQPSTERKKGQRKGELSRYFFGANSHHRQAEPRRFVIMKRVCGNQYKITFRAGISLSVHVLCQRSLYHNQSGRPFPPRSTDAQCFGLFFTRTHKPNEAISAYPHL